MAIVRRLRWALLLLPLLIPMLTSNEYIVHSVLVTACVYAIVVAGLDLVVGYNGDVSVGHAGLFGIGAYTAGVLVFKLGALNDRDPKLPCARDQKQFRNFAEFCARY